MFFHRDMREIEIRREIEIEIRREIEIEIEKVRSLLMFSSSHCLAKRNYW